ncbi:AAA family ATPase [Halodesulfovibrio sp.]|jgi:pilus assembly protein CpaE|uniref:AAA family ATPase n=1 Tax=Halodesulfovibrio sp. TaxID=1912772 RepID=UPI0025F70CF6|nr:AAA family ATPase [Halodesulfovibrio sp.]MCT4625442.1 AAA family ATPase [Halodesulfovibrio sp.]
MLFSRTTNQVHTVAGFISNPQLADDISYTLSLLGFTDNIFIKSGTVEDAKEYCIKTPSPKLLIIDISKELEPVLQLDSLANHVEPGTKVLAFGTHNNIDLYRELMNMGISDYLSFPVDNGLLERTIKCALSLSTNDRKSSGRLVPIIGTKGGCGVSTVTASLGSLLSSKYGCRTVIADLDRHCGDLDMLLNTKAANTLDMLLTDEQRARTMLVDHATDAVSKNLSLLKSNLGFETPNAPVSTNALTALNEKLCEHHNFVLWDTPLHSLGTPAVQEMLGMADIAVVVFTPTVSSARGLKEVLSMVKKTGSARTIVCVNRIHPTAVENIKLTDLKKLTGQEIDIILPHSPKAAVLAADTGKFVKGKLGTSLDSLACKLIGRRHKSGLIARLKKRA